MSKPVVVFVLGGPGSGKGTQCNLVEKHLGFAHISAGECLREERNTASSQYGSLIEKCMTSGSIVPVAITCALLKAKMEKLGWEKGKFLIDGFPRNQDNVDGWESVMGDGVDVRFCLFLDCPLEVMVERVLQRSKTSGRIDDTMDVIRRRLKSHETLSAPIIAMFEAQNKLRVVNASNDVETVWKDVKGIFDKEFSSN